MRHVGFQMKRAGELPIASLRRPELYPHPNKVLTRQHEVTMPLRCYILAEKCQKLVKTCQMGLPAPVQTGFKFFAKALRIGYGA